MNPVDSVDSCGFYWQLAGPFLFSNLNLNVELRTVPAIHSPFWFDVSSADRKAVVLYMLLLCGFSFNIAKHSCPAFEKGIP